MQIKVYAWRIRDVGFLKCCSAGGAVIFFSDEYLNSDKISGGYTILETGWRHE